MIKLNHHQSELVKFILGLRQEKNLVDYISNRTISSLKKLRHICRSKEWSYKTATQMNNRQAREVLEAVIVELSSTRLIGVEGINPCSEIKLEQRVTATECMQSRIDIEKEIMTKFYGAPRITATEDSKNQCTLEGIDFSKIEELARRQIEKQEHYAFMYSGTRTMWIDPAAQEIQFFKSTNVRGKATMNTETLNLVKGRDVRELSEGKLIDIQNDVKEEVTHTENSIVALQERLRVAKEKLSTLKTDIKVIGEHIKDKRNQNKLDS